MKNERSEVVVERNLQVDQLINNEQNEQCGEQPIDNEQNVLQVDPPTDDHSIINENWCRIDDSNILPNRTRPK